MLNRRQFGTTSLKGIALLAVAASWFGTSAASCADVFARISAYVGVGISAVTSVVNLLAGAGIITLPEGTLISLVLNMIKAAWADVTKAVADYQNAPAASKATFAQKLSTALAAVQAEIQQFWSDVKIPDAQLASTVAGLLGLVVSTIAGFITALPAPTPTPSMAAAKPLKKTLIVTPKQLSPTEFRKQFNAILAANGHQQYSIM